MSENRCKVCRKALVRRRGESDYQWRERATCSRSCGAKWGRRQREDYVVFQPHRCLFDGCEAWVPRHEGEHDSDYRRRRYCCAEHRDIGRVRTVLGKSVDKPTRECACGCGVAFVPKRHTVRFATKGCANRARVDIGPRPIKVCQCGCATPFERPIGMSTAEWETRRFVDRHHRDRWQARPGAARAGNRTAPRPVPSRDRKKAPERVDSRPDATPVQEAPKPTPPTFRPGLVPPVVERSTPRVAGRPSFGLTRRQAG